MGNGNNAIAATGNIKPGISAWADASCANLSSAIAASAIAAPAHRWSRTPDREAKHGSAYHGCALAGGELHRIGGRAGGEAGFSRPGTLSAHARWPAGEAL